MSARELELLAAIAAHVERGEHEAAARAAEDALAGGLSAERVLAEGLLPGMDVVGRSFRDHLIFLPDVLLAARAMHAGLAVVKPRLIGGELPTRGTVVLGTVRGDVHDIGKNLVGIMLQGAGYRVVDLGHSVPAERFVDAAVEHGARVIGMSALLTTTMTGMAEVVELVASRGLRERISILVGGAPVTADFAGSIGADAYGFDAADAVARVEQLLEAAT